MLRNVTVNKVLDKFKSCKNAKIIDKVDVLYIGNNGCHVNCLSYAKAHKKEVSCIVGGIQQFYDNDIVVHFIIKLKNGKYIDPTFGNMSSNLYKRFIIINTYKYKNFKPNTELMALKYYVYNTLPWYLKIFTNKNDTF